MNSHQFLNWGTEPKSLRTAGIEDDIENNFWIYDYSQVTQYNK